MIQVNRTSCCGMREVGGLSSVKDSEKALYDICKEMYTQNKNGAFILFSAPATQKYGDSLKRAIIRNDLGTVQKFRAKHNPNSGNMLNIYSWAVSKQKSRSWYSKESTRRSPKFKVGDEALVVNWRRMYVSNSDATELGLPKYEGDYHYYEKKSKTTKCTISAVGADQMAGVLGVLTPNGKEYLINDSGVRK